MRLFIIKLESNMVSVEDILIVDGIISEIKSSIASKADHTIKSKNLCVSGGWLDIGCFNGEPGYEYREDLDSLRGCSGARRIYSSSTFPDRSTSYG